MKDIRITTAIVAAVVALSFANVPAANAGDTFAFSFDTGAVAFAYSDGYWDREHNWHGWRNAREAREYRHQNPHTYRASRHTREHNNGWRDEDHDGVPNRADHDRDGDGVSNRHDAAPDNPNRR